MQASLIISAIKTKLFPEPTEEKLEEKAKKLLLHFYFHMRYQHTRLGFNTAVLDYQEARLSFVHIMTLPEGQKKEPLQKLIKKLKRMNRRVSI